MRKSKKMSDRQKTYILMVIPALLLFVAFNTIPLITGAMYSFTNYRGYGSYEFVGLRNYIDLFTDSRVGNSYLFTFKYAIAGTILVNLLSLLLALGLNSKIKCKSLLRGVYFLPNILGGLIIGYIFSFIFTYIIPAIGSALHLGFLENSILASEKYAWIGVLIVGVWQAVAMNTIIYISGLQTIPVQAVGRPSRILHFQCLCPSFPQILSSAQRICLWYSTRSWLSQRAAPLRAPNPFPTLSTKTVWTADSLDSRAQMQWYSL